MNPYASLGGYIPTPYTNDVTGVLNTSLFLYKNLRGGTFGSVTPVGNPGVIPVIIGGRRGVVLMNWVEA